jgi:hypothetical protein
LNQEKWVEVIRSMIALVGADIADRTLNSNAIMFEGER